MGKNKNKKSTLKIISIIAAVIGGLAAIGMFLLRKMRSIGETLDYKGDIYEDDDILENEFEDDEVEHIVVDDSYEAAEEVGVDSESEEDDAVEENTEENKE